jgi:hypothetical protein
VRTSEVLWAEALDAFALELEHQRLAFSEGRHGDVTEFAFPEGRVPAGQEDHAQQLLRDSLELETAVAAAFDDLNRRRAISTRKVSRARHAGERHPTASFFDSVG